MKKQIEEMAELIEDVGEYTITSATDCFIKAKLESFVVARKLYEAGYRKQEWIIVEERLPEKNYHDYVLAWNGLHIEFLHYNHRYKQWEDYFSLKKHPWKVTHWMPLPEPPTMNEGAE